MTFITLIPLLNPKIFDIIMDEFVFNNPLLNDRNKTIKIEINFMNILYDGTEDKAYPDFNYKLTGFTDALFTKAEIAGKLYFHYKDFDIDDDYIEYVIVSISVY
jgi:hypothetical protein